ncbi:MAG: sulfotransferase family 2 domain-containing protein [Flavobacteriaceae bacterium]|jgi:hypothetical protein|nr:sulfotransferase family 2 domain-containing protein [Flavobacteriaceae bacterium]MCB0485311.1 sulfotransferase family 2 domain-containing protein [Flavobacteriaceae bacterium]
MKIPIIEPIKNKIGLKLNSPIRKGFKQDVIFIHINKTAGTSIINITGKPFRKHLTAKEIIKAVGKKKWNKAYKFSVVRNPWDKMVSHYKHNIKVNPKRMMDGDAIITFEKWIKCTLGENKIKKFYNRPQHFLPQVEWLKDDEGAIKIDKIIKFENLNEDFRDVAEALGINEELPHLNKTRKTNYKDFYNDEIRNMVADWFAEDIKMFNYSF